MEYIIWQQYLFMLWLQNKVETKSFCHLKCYKGKENKAEKSLKKQRKNVHMENRKKNHANHDQTIIENIEMNEKKKKNKKFLNRD